MSTQGTLLERRKKNTLDANQRGQLIGFLMGADGQDEISGWSKKDICILAGARLRWDFIPAVTTYDAAVESMLAATLIERPPNDRERPKGAPDPTLVIGEAMAARGLAERNGKPDTECAAPQEFATVEAVQNLTFLVRDMIAVVQDYVQHGSPAELNDGLQEISEQVPELVAATTACGPPLF